MLNTYGIDLRSVLDKPESTIEMAAGSTAAIGMFVKESSDTAVAVAGPEDKPLGMVVELIDDGTTYGRVVIATKFTADMVTHSDVGATSVTDVRFIEYTGSKYKVAGEPTAASTYYKALTMLGSAASGGGDTIKVYFDAFNISSTVVS